MILIGLLLTTGVVAISYANDDSVEQIPHHIMHMNETNVDNRISLNLPPQMKQHQLSNMRSHLVAIQDIIGFIAVENFEQASQIARSKLGLTEEMKKMCNMFDNKSFTELGLAFHKSGDVLGDVLQEKDTVKSLQALRSTMNYCIQCHATFRQ